MRLINEGKGIIWSDGEEGEIDKKILALQRQYSKQCLSIWGTDDCYRCGACCYMFKKDDKPQFTTCQYLNTETEAECLKQDDKPRECTDWKCWGPITGTPKQRYQLMRIAVDILKTKTEKDILDLIE